MPTVTTNYEFGKPIVGETNWTGTINSTFDKIDTALSQINAINQGLAGLPASSIKGTFQSNVTYAVSDVVFGSNGKVYIAERAGLTTDPATTDNSSTGSSLSSPAGSSTANQFGPTTDSINGALINTSGGTVGNGSAYNVSPYCYIGGATQFCTNAAVFGGNNDTTFGMAFYDINKSFIGWTSNYTPSEGTAAVPPYVYSVSVTGAAYVRFTWVSPAANSNTSQSIATIMVVKGTTLPSTYVAFAPAVPINMVTGSGWKEILGQGVQGGAGAQGSNGVASLVSLAKLRVNQMPVGANLFQKATKVLGSLIDYSNGQLFAYSGGMATDFIPANSGDVMSISSPVSAYNGSVSQPGSSTANKYDYTAQSGPSNGQILDATTGSYSSGTFNGYGTSPYVYVAGASSLTTNAPIFYGFQNSGIAFYDASKNYISGVTTGTSGTSNLPAQIITLPSGTVYVRWAILYYNDSGSSFMASLGSNTLPSTYVAFAPYTSGTKTNGVAYYDQNQNYLRGTAGNGSILQNISIGNDVAFLRIGFASDVSSSLMVTNTSASPSTYLDAGYLSPSQTLSLINSGGGGGGGTSPSSPTSMLTLWPAMAGVSCWLPFQDGSGSTVADVSGNNKNGTIGGDTTTPGTWSNVVGFRPNTQTVTIPNMNGRPSNGFVAYFPAATPAAQSAYNMVGGLSTSDMNSWRIRGSYGIGSDHGNYAFFPAIGLSAGGDSCRVVDGLSGIHAIEIVIGDGGSIPDRIYIDGHEGTYVFQNSLGNAVLGGSQLTNSIILGSAASSLPCVFYGFWSSDTRDTPAQAMARTASELRRVSALGVKVGIKPTSTAPDSILAVTGTSIDVGYMASQTPSSLLALNFPCTIYNLAVSGQACKDMTAGFEDREATVFHSEGERNIAYHGGVTNGIVAYQESPQNALQDMLAWNRKAKALGYKTIASTMISRGGTGYNNQTGDALAQIFNALLLAVGDEFDYIAHLAADPALGATNAYSNTVNFPDSVHPNNAGQAHLVAIMRAAVQGVYGIPQTIVSGNYTQTDRDRVIIQTATSNSTLTLKSAINQSFNSAGKLTITNAGNSTLTVAAVNSQTINGAANLNVAAGSSIRLLPYVLNPAAGGANWITI